jgi:hypothetical protein
MKESTWRIHIFAIIDGVRGDHPEAKVSKLCKLKR